MSKVAWPALIPVLPPLAGAEGRDQRGHAGYIKAVGLAGVQLQVTYLPAYGLDPLAGWMFWLMWNTLSGS